jgi:hypothetical protein
MAAPSANLLNDLADMASTPTTAPQEKQGLELAECPVSAPTSDGTDMATSSEHQPEQAVSAINDSAKAVASPPKTLCTFAVHTGLTDSP